MDPVPATRLMPSFPPSEPAQLHTMSFPTLARGRCASNPSKSASSALSSPCAGKPAKADRSAAVVSPACRNASSTPSRISERSASKPISR